MKIKGLLIFFPAALMLGCGPSPQEKKEIAIITCNVMGESRKMDAAMRIKEINEARDKIGEAPFLQPDNAIKEAFEYGLCKELVLNDSYDAKLNKLKRLEEQREKKEAEARRIREEKLARRAAERKKKAEAEREEAQEQWRSALMEVLRKRNYRPEIIKVDFDEKYQWFRFFFNCAEIEGFRYTLGVVLSDNLGVLEESEREGSCPPGVDNGITFDYTGALLEEMFQGRNVETLIERVYIEVYGVYRLGNRRLTEELSPESFPPLQDMALLDDPIVYEVDIEIFTEILDGSIFELAHP